MNDQLSVVQWTTDPDLRLTNCSGLGSAAEDFGVDSAVGKTVSELFGVEGSDSPLIDAHRRALLGQSAPWEALLAGRLYRGVVSPRHDGNGRVVGCLGVAQEEVAKIPADDELFFNLLESAPDAMVISDSNGVILAVNRLVEQLFAYPRDELLGRQIEMLVPQRFRSQHHGHRAAYRDNPHVRRMGGSGSELLAVRKDGREFPVEISLSPFKTAKGILVFSAIRDVTERRRIEGELRDKDFQLLTAQKIQECLLPQVPPSIPGFDIAGAAFPAEFAAGDHFDYLRMMDGSTALVVGDVSGHGFSSALLMGSTHCRLRVLAELNLDIDAMLARVNNALVAETDEGQFVTVFLGRLDPNNRTLVHTSAGHPPGYVLAPSGEVKAVLESTSIPLAILPDIEFPIAAPVQLDPGDLILLLTDGVLEAAAEDGTMFGTERTLALVRENRHRAAREIVHELYQAVRSHSENQRLLDDVTVMVIKVAPEED